MKKRFLLIASLAIIVVTSAILTSKFLIPNADNERFVLLSPPDGIELKDKTKESEKESIKFWKWFSRSARANPETGEIALDDMLKARQSHAELRDRVRNRRSSNLNLEFEFMGPNNKGGRTRDILIDKDNPNRIYTGGVSGGLYISNNGGASWQAYLASDTLAGIGVVSLTQTTNGDIYVGTGEYISANRAIGLGRSLSFIGEGIWKSTDGGETFNQIPSTAPVPDNSNDAQFSFVNELAAHPTDGNIILAGTADGLVKSEDGGQTWDDASNALGMNGRDIQDIAVTSTGTVHVAASGQYWKGEIDDPDSYKNVAFGASFIDLKLGVAPSDENYVYAIGCNGDGQTTGLFRSTDAGETWRNIGPETLPSDGFNPTGSQGEYDMEIAVHPEDRDIAYTAGQLAMYEYNYSEESGQQKDFWWPISNWWSGSPAVDPHYVHADHHRMVFHPNNPDMMYVATDGGIYRTREARSEYPNPPVFEQLNKGYGVAQFNDISVNLEGQVIGGTQDNGVLILDFNQNEPEHAFRASGFGDGGYCEASKLNSNAYFASSYFGILARSANGGAGFSEFYDENIDGDGDGLPDGGAPFVATTELYEYTDTAEAKYGTGLFFFGAFDGIWAAYDALNFGSIPVWFHIASSQNGLDMPSATYTAMEMTSDGKHLFVASGDPGSWGPGNGAVYRISGLDTVEWVYNDNGTPENPEDDFFDPNEAGIEVTTIAEFPDRFVTDIAVDKNNAEHIVVALGNYGQTNYVYRSTNAVSATGTGSFSPIQNNLPRMPVYSILIDYYNSQHIIAGTELGVYSSDFNGSNWSPEFDGLPTTPVLTLAQEVVNDIDGDCYILYVGTYGKSLYATTSLSPAGCTIPRGQFVGQEPSPKVASESLKAYPNPAGNTLNLSFSLNDPSPTETLVYNLQGQAVMRKQNGKLTGGEHDISLDVSELANGTYLVVVRSEQDQATTKVMISR